MLTTWDEHRLLYLYTQVVLKVTLLIYFNENHNRHKERSFQLQSTFSAFSLLQMCIFATNKSQKAALENICTSKGDTLSSLLRCITHCLTVHTFTAWSIEAFSNCCWMSIDNFLHKVEFSDSPLLHTHCYVRCNFDSLLLCCQLLHSNNTERNTAGKVHPLMLYHQHLPWMLWTEIITCETLLLEQH